MKSIILFTCVALAWGDDNIFQKPLVDQNLYEQLFYQGEITNTFTGKELPELLSQSEWMQKINTRIKEKKPTVGVEVLYHQPLCSLDLDENGRMEDIYIAFRSVSELSGVEFYSKKAKKYYLAFKEVYALDQYGKKTGDPVKLDMIPSFESIKILFNEPNLGKFTNTIDYFMGDEAVFLNLRNETTMKYLFIPVVKPGNSSIFVAAWVEGDQLILYGMSWIKTFSLFGLVEKCDYILLNRLRVIFAWHLKSLNQESGERVPIITREKM